MGYDTDTFRPIYSGSVSFVSVPGLSGSSQLIMSASLQRRGGLICNDSAASLYLLFANLQGTSASMSTFSVKVMSGSTYELPKPVFLGEIHGIWDSDGGSAKVTYFEIDDDWRY